MKPSCESNPTASAPAPAASEALLRATLHSIGDAVIATDPAGRVMLLNPVAERLTGWTEAEAHGRPLDAILRILDESSRAPVASPVARVLREGVVVALADHTLLMARDGTERPLAGVGAPIRARGDVIAGVVLVFRDQTAERAAARAAAEARAWAESLVATVREPLLVLDADLRVVSANPSFYRAFQVTPAETERRLVYELGNRQWDIPALRRLLEDLLPQNTQFNDLEVTHDFERLGRRTMRLNARRVYRDAHRTDFILLAIEDVTERQRAEERWRALNAELRVATEKAQTADRLKSAFLATMSHELRTPLNSILGFTGILLQGLAGPLNPEQIKQLGIVQNSARHLLALINDVLDLSKIEAGELKVSRERFDLRASIEKAVATVRPLAETKRLALRLALGPEIGAAVGDARRVEQILLNLMSNAIKFTEHGEIALTAEVSGDTARLRIADSGTGIRPEDMPTLFKPFHQIESGLARVHEGTGLGLVISRRLAELMGGELCVESEWGKGSVFTFTLPLKELPKP